MEDCGLGIIQDHLEETKSRHEKKLEQLEKKIDGVPERLENVEDKIATLSSTIADFIKELRKGYVNKETCLLCRQKIEADIERNSYNNRVISRVIWGMVASGCSVLVGLVIARLGLI